MSCFIVEHAHIDVIVTALIDSYESRGWSKVIAGEVPSTENADHIGTALLALNASSYRQRYGGNVQINMHRFRRVVGLTTLEKLKAVSCWLYQSCEGGCDKHPDFQAMREFERHLALEFATSRPEYKDIPWSRNESNVDRNTVLLFDFIKKGA